MRSTTHVRLATCRTGIAPIELETLGARVDVLNINAGDTIVLTVPSVLTYEPRCHLMKTLFKRARERGAELVLLEGGMGVQCLLRANAADLKTKEGSR